ncbi:MAG TPA: trigger factor [Acidimicrobiales bacterium]|nr:trigger factor [Acidimicrobiales bacterium]HVC70691.1 trigger factor [Acidimicrobiales bacterium]
MRASAAPVEGNRVRLSVEIDESEVDAALATTVRRLARDVRIPGFRPGRVPRPVLEARMGGAEALRQQAINDALPDLYAQAVVDTEVDPISAPEIDITSGEDHGPVTFDAVVEVRPTVSIAGYAGLVVTVPGVEVTDEDIDAQVDRVREHSGELEVVVRPARDGDYVTIDLHGSRPVGDDLDVEDYMYEVGSGSDIAGLDDQLRGSSVGDILQFSAEIAGPDGVGQSTSFRVLMKAIKEKILPEPTDAWASEASEFDTLAALRDDLGTKLRQIKVMQANMALRSRAVEALTELVQDEPPESLIDAEVRERLHDLGHRLEQRHISLDQFLQASGRDRAGLLAELQAEAASAVRADLALRALADAEELEVSDEELDAVVGEMAQQAGTTGADLRRRLDRAGRLPAVRSDQRKAKALEWLLEHVELVDEEGKPIDRGDLRRDDVMQEALNGLADRGDGAGAGDRGEQGSEDVGAEEGATVEAEA